MYDITLEFHICKDWQKGIEEMNEAIEMIKQKHPDATLNIKVFFEQLISQH